MGADPAFVASRFWSKVLPTDGCWEWQGGKDADGYGRFYAGRRPSKAHRVALAYMGWPLPDGLVVDHKCRNRACVNPGHLRTVTRAVNVHENSQAPGHLNALKSHCLRGHPLSGPNLYTRKNGKRECLKCCALRERKRYAAAR